MLNLKLQFIVMKENYFVPVKEKKNLPTLCNNYFMRIKYACNFFLQPSFFCNIFAFVFC